MQDQTTCIILINKPSNMLINESRIHEKEEITLLLWFASILPLSFTLTRNGSSTSDPRSPHSLSSAPVLISATLQPWSCSAPRLVFYYPISLFLCLQPYFSDKEGEDQRTSGSTSLSACTSPSSSSSHWPPLTALLRSNRKEESWRTRCQFLVQP